MRGLKAKQLNRIFSNHPAGRSLRGERILLKTELACVAWLMNDGRQMNPRALPQYSSSLSCDVLRVASPRCWSELPSFAGNSAAGTIPLENRKAVDVCRIETSFRMTALPLGSSGLKQQRVPIGKLQRFRTCQNLKTPPSVPRSPITARGRRPLNRSSSVNPAASLGKDRRGARALPKSLELHT